MKSFNLENYNNIHLIGVGGASMYTIAATLKKMGKNVTGSDMQESSNTLYLKNMGIEIIIGHEIDLVSKAELVIYTAAINPDDPEFKYAKEHGIRLIDRAEFLGEFTKNYENLICVSGTHGKSTTTSMVASVFLEANLNPTIQIGASLKKINGNYYIGGNKYYILEACEYKDSFLNFHPTSEIILNIDDDHLDYFKTIENTKKSFSKYVDNLPHDGLLVVNMDDENTKELWTKNKKVITFGIDNEKAMVKASNISYSDLGFPSFDVTIDDKFYDNFTLRVRGKHNVMDALATIALANYYQIDKEIIKKALKEYTGVGRRFEYLGEYNKAHIFDDFAHHPTEILTTYNSSLSVKHHKTWAVFQSHTYSRTYEHLEHFAEVLAKFDNIIIADIYPAREENIWGVKESDLVNLIKKTNPNVRHIATYPEIAEFLKNNVQENDLILTIGAGPVNKVAELLLQKK